jgi:hypothetical protein
MAGLDQAWRRAQTGTRAPQMSNWSQPPPAGAKPPPVGAQQQPALTNWSQPPPGYQRWQPGSTDVRLPQVTPPTGQAPAMGGQQPQEWDPQRAAYQRDMEARLRASQQPQLDQQFYAQRGIPQQQPAGGSAGGQMTGGGGGSAGGQMSDMRQQAGQQEQMARGQLDQAYRQKQAGPAGGGQSGGSQMVLENRMGGGQDRPAPFGGSGPPFGEHMGGNPFAGNPFGGGEGAPPTFPPKPRGKPRAKPAAKKGAPAKAGAKSSSKAPPKAAAKAKPAARKAPPFGRKK